MTAGRCWWNEAVFMAFQYAVLKLSILPEALFHALLATHTKIA